MLHSQSLSLITCNHTKVGYITVTYLNSSSKLSFWILHYVILNVDLASEIDKKLHLDSPDGMSYQYVPLINHFLVGIFSEEFTNITPN